MTRKEPFAEKSQRVHDEAAFAFLDSPTTREQMIDEAVRRAEAKYSFLYMNDVKRTWPYENALTLPCGIEEQIRAEFNRIVSHGNS